MMTSGGEANRSVVKCAASCGDQNHIGLKKTRCDMTTMIYPQVEGITPIVVDTDNLVSIKNECKIAHGVYENRIWCSCGFIKRITGEEENYNFCPKCGTKVTQ